MKGLDLSKWNAGLNLNDVKNAGYGFVILRGAYTSNGSVRTKHKDISFETFYQQAKALGIPAGVYYYSCAITRAEGISEAEFLIENCLKGKQFEFPIYIDVEDNNWQYNKKNKVTDAILGFCDHLRNNGYYAGVYASKGWFDSFIDYTRLDEYTKWLACWRSIAPKMPFAYDMWQYSDSGKIGSFRVDTNEAIIDFESIIKSKGLNGYSESHNDDIEKIVDDVLAGKYGNGEARKELLTEAGYDYKEVQKKVNERLATHKPVTKELVARVIEGKYGNGETRKAKLEAEGYDYKEVQKAVNEWLG